MKTRCVFLFAAMLAIIAVISLEAQQIKKRLAILPFSGGEAQDGETISVLLSNQQALRDVFAIQPRNNAIDQIMKEQQYQRQSGLINSDAISEIGKLKTADMVVSGYITKLKDTKLIIISIIDVTEIQQIAGIHKTYSSIEEIRGMLPELSRNLADMSNKKYDENTPGLAVPSFVVPPTVDRNDAMVLAQILATEIVKFGKYAVFPRNKSVDDVLKEHQFQRSGQTAGTSALGTSHKIEYVLSSSVMSLGKTNLFTAQILNIEDGELINGDDKEYQDISDGLGKNLMQQIAQKLSTIMNTSVRQEEAKTQEETKIKEEQTRKSAEETAWLKTVSVIKDTETYTRAMAAINGDTVGGTYTLTIGASFPVGSVGLHGTDSKPAKTVILKSSGSTCVLSSNGTGGLFTLSGNKITLILDGNITLDGNYQKNSVVSIFGGTLILKSGSTIRNARNSGVWIDSGQFTMDGGNITNNMHDSVGGGVRVIGEYGVFVMNGGTINGNKAENGGGGVCVTGGEFIMNGGTISGNTVQWNWGGGGVCSYGGGKFTMYGGTITGNSVIDADGGGVFVDSNGKFVKSGGTIDATNKARRGKVAFYLRSNNSSQKRDAAAGPSVNISSLIPNRSGGWE